MPTNALPGPGRRPGDLLIERLWLIALTPGRRMPMPTVERIQTLKCLAAEWRAIDEAEASHVE